MPNLFDQFDSAPSGGNVFDQFDAPAQGVGFTGPAASGGIGSKRTTGLLGMFSIPNIIQGLYETAKAAPEVTKQVMTGQLDPASEQGIKQVAPLASLAVLPSPGRSMAQPRPIEPPALTPEAVTASAKAGYQKAENLGFEAKPNAIHEGLNTIKTGLKVDPDLAPTTLKMLDREIAAYAPKEADAMSALTRSTPAERPPVTVPDLTSFRERLNDAIQESSLGNKDRAAALQVRSKLDDLMQGLQPEQVIKGNPAELGSTLAAARGDFAAQMRNEAIQNMKTRALDRAGGSNSGANIENALRTEIRAFIKPDNRGVSQAKMSGFNETEIAHMRLFSREGAKGQSNTLRFMGNLLGGGGGLGAVVTSGLAHSVMGPLGYALPAAGAGIKSIGNTMARKGVDALAQTTLERAPLALSLPAPVRLPPTALPRPRLPPATLGLPAAFRFQDAR